MKKISLVLLVVVMIFGLAACGGGGGSDDPNLGTYVCTGVEMLGTEVGPDVAFPGGASMELKANGKGSMTVDDATDSITWVVDGTNITVTLSDQDSVGTIENGVIVLDMLGTGMNATFERE